MPASFVITVSVEPFLIIFMIDFIILIIILFTGHGNMKGVGLYSINVI